MIRAKIEQLEDEIAKPLKEVGFNTSRRSGGLEYLMDLGNLCEMFFRPGITKVANELRIDPVVGLNYLPLMEALKDQADVTPQVCHALLSMIDGVCVDWDYGPLYTQSRDEELTATRTVAMATIQHGLPLLKRYASLNGVQALLERTVRPIGVVTMQESRKLEVLAALA